jgi:hypothetical protein
MMDRDSGRPQGGSPQLGDGRLPEGIVVCFFTRRRLQPIDPVNSEPVSDDAAGTGVEEAAAAPGAPTGPSLGERNAWQTGAIALLSLALIWAYSWALSQMLRALMDVRILTLF